MMNILQPFLWYRHITRGVYYDTAINMRNRKTNEPDVTTALMFTSMVYCGGHVAVLYFVILFNFQIDSLHTALTGVVIFSSHKGPFNLLVLLCFVISFLVALLCCRWNVTYEEIAEEFNHKKPGHLFSFVATLTVPALGFAAGMYAVSQEHKRYGLNEVPYIEVRQEVVGAPLQNIRFLLSDQSRNLQTPPKPTAAAAERAIRSEHGRCERANAVVPVLALPR